MVRRSGMLCLLVGMVGLAAVQARAADSGFLGPLRQQWESNRNLVVRVAEVIPEDKYDYRPTPEVRTIREQFTHIIGENFMYMGFVTGDPPRDMTRINNLKTRAEILKAINESYDYGAKALAGLDDPKAVEMISMRNQQVPRWAAVLAVIVDNMDHYGNLVVYMRLNGIVPPRTAARQQQQR